MEDWTAPSRGVFVGVPKRETLATRWLSRYAAATWSTSHPARRRLFATFADVTIRLCLCRTRQGVG